MPTLTLYPIADTDVSRNGADIDRVVHSPGTLMVNNMPYDEAVAFIKFDLSGLPQGVAIVSANLRVIVKGIAGSNTTDNIGVQRVLGDWSEMNTKYTNQPSRSSTYQSAIASKTDGQEVNFDVRQLIQDDVNTTRAYGFGLSNESPNGYKLFYARESDRPPVLTITYNSPPNAPSLSSPVNGSITNNRHPYFSWSFSDSDPEDYQTAWQLQVSAGDGGAFSNIVLDTGKIGSGQQSWQHDWTELGDNQYFYRIRTWDKADVVSQWSWVPWFGIENSPPTFSVPGTQFRIVPLNESFQVDANNVQDNWSGVQKVKFAVWTDKNGQDDLKWYDGIRDSNHWYAHIPIADHNNEEGTYICHVYAYDNAGNYASNGYNIVVDRTAPTVSIRGTDYVGKSRNISIEWDYGDNLLDQKQYFIEIVNEAYNAILWNSGWIEDMWARTYNLPDMGSDVTYFVRMAVMDMAGNISGPIEATNRKITIDNTAPKIGRVTGNNQIDNPQYTNISSETYRVWALNVTDERSGISRVRFPTCNVTQSGGTTWIWYDGVRDGNTNNWFCDIKLADFGNAEGVYYTDVYAYDNAGNESDHPRVTTSVDRTPPGVTSVQDYSCTNQTTGTRRVWIYGVHDGGSGVSRVETQYKKPGDSTIYSGGNAGQSGTDFYVDVPVSVNGEYTVIFYPYDRAGNVKQGGYTTSFFVDSQRANDPKPSVVWGTTMATFTWFPFNDPTPSSGLDRTALHVDRWNGTDWVFDVDINNDGSPDPWYVLPDKNQLEHTVTTLIPGTRYRYTVKHFDQAQNESAYTYYEFVTKKKIGEVSLGGTTSHLPVYDMNSGVLGSKELRIALPSGTGCFELVSTSDASASALRLMTSQGIKALSK
ncbi:DNRLRE domain-containing protein [Paenibacillus sp. OAS669]|uniref:DNRLRE domain-containing protein n=1 Tax=Paenibacillus sp. OAS669 TaxID=2663821 RepID=UPI001789671E|nr:DNRLRE domain-containing protein [Paenibacillus sp. OAS669]MBE1444181.1 hypothetical protein [Paenibacillus sp. OAS669]